MPPEVLSPRLDARQNSLSSRRRRQVSESGNRRATSLPSLQSVPTASGTATAQTGRPSNTLQSVRSSSIRSPGGDLVTASSVRSDSTITTLTTIPQSPSPDAFHSPMSKLTLASSASVPKPYPKQSSTLQTHHRSRSMSSRPAKTHEPSRRTPLVRSRSRPSSRRTSLDADRLTTTSKFGKPIPSLSDQRSGSRSMSRGLEKLRPTISRSASDRRGRSRARSRTTSGSRSPSNSQSGGDDFGRRVRFDDEPRIANDGVSNILPADVDEVFEYFERNNLSQPASRGTSRAVSVSASPVRTPIFRKRNKTDEQARFEFEKQYEI